MLHGPHATPTALALHHSQSGKGAGAFLNTPADPEEIMDDELFSIGVSARLLEPWAGQPPDQHIPNTPTTQLDPQTQPSQNQPPSIQPDPVDASHPPTVIPWLPQSPIYTTPSNPTPSAQPVPAGAGPTQHTQPQPTPGCPRVSGKGERCNRALDPQCVHARLCRFGGAVIRRHDAVVKALARVIHNVTGAKTHLERRDTELARIFKGKVQQGQMDIIVVQYGSTTRYIDVTVVSPVTADHHFVIESANKPGHAASRAESFKRTRYPHAALVPFAMEIGGRLGPSAQSYLQSLFREPGASTEYTMSDAFTTLSTALHTHTSQQIHTAHLTDSVADPTE